MEHGEEMTPCSVLPAPCFPHNRYRLPNRKSFAEFQVLRQISAEVAIAANAGDSSLRCHLAKPQARIWAGLRQFDPTDYEIRPAFHRDDSGRMHECAGRQSRMPADGR